MIRPTRRALGVWAVGLVPAALPVLVAPTWWPVWVGWSALVLLALGVDALGLPPATALRVECEPPEALPVGRATVVPLRLALAEVAPEDALRAELTVDADDRLEPLETRRTELSGQTVEIDLPLVPKRRGRARLTAAWVRWDGTWGLARRAVRLPLEVSIPVVPDLARVRDAALAFFRARNALAGVKVETYSGDGSEFESLRDFQPGLDTRSIDWKASARHTTLLSREFRAERNHQIVFGLDTGRLMAEPVAGAPLLDHAIHTLLLLAQISLRHGDRVRLFPFAARPQVLSAARSGPRALQEMIRLTTDLDYSQEETNFTLALTDLATRLRRRSLVLVLTDFVDSVTAELMVENVLRLKRRHLVLFVAFRDPGLRDLAEREPRSLDVLDRAVVAASLLKEREAVLGRLRKAGVFALDAAPREVGPRLVNRYLEIKRREMIG